MSIENTLAKLTCHHLHLICKVGLCAYLWASCQVFSMLGIYKSGGSQQSLSVHQGGYKPIPWDSVARIFILGIPESFTVGFTEIFSLTEWKSASYSFIAFPPYYPPSLSGSPKALGVGGRSYSFSPRQVTLIDKATKAIKMQLHPFQKLPFLYVWKNKV